jgi:hypothetical protein
MTLDLELLDLEVEVTGVLVERELEETIRLELERNELLALDRELGVIASEVTEADVVVPLHTAPVTAGLSAVPPRLST